MEKWMFCEIKSATLVYTRENHKLSSWRFEHFYRSEVFVIFLDGLGLGKGLWCIMVGKSIDLKFSEQINQAYFEQLSFILFWNQTRQTHCNINRYKYPKINNPYMFLRVTNTVFRMSTWSMILIQCWLVYQKGT
jgi:hypothetical protein